MSFETQRCKAQVQADLFQISEVGGAVKLKENDEKYHKV